MVNNSTNINKSNNHLSPIEHNKFKVYYLPTYDCCEQLSLYVFIMYYCLLMVFVEYHNKLLFYKKNKICFIFITVSEEEDYNSILNVWK
jgi:hypothetical protein